MNRQTDLVKARFKEASHWLMAPLRLKKKHITHLIVKTTIPLALLLVTDAASVQAALRGPKTTTVTRSGRYQLPYVTAPSRGGQRNFGRSSGFVGSGFMNPNLMVMTSQGVMHRDAAIRLGLPYTPITGGSSEGPGR